jgi:hypothetical protein
MLSIRHDLGSRRSRLRGLALAALGLASVHCGAKTGLDTPDVEFEIDTDASIDVSDVVDVVDAADVVVDVPPRMVTCRPVRYFARLGAVTNVRPDLDAPVLGTGFVWSLQSRPPMSNGRIFSDGTDTAVITPDVVGEFVLSVEVPARGPMGPLRCQVTVVAQPPDPRCPGYALVEPRVALIPSSSASIALDISFTDPVRVDGSSSGAVLAEDRVARASVAALSRATVATGAQDVVLSLEGGRTESDARRALEALGSSDSLFVGRTSQLRSGGVARRTTMRLLANGDLSVDAVRDAIVRGLVAGAGAIAPVGQAPARAFTIELSTLVIPAENRTIVLVAVAPEGLVEDLSTITSVRLDDFANASGVGFRGEALDTRCHQVRATRQLQADFLWFVDTSGSMLDDQQRVGRTGQRFFLDLTQAGVDFRVGVFQAGTQEVSLRSEPGTGRTFSWIPGSSPMGARDLAWRVTEESFEAGDNLRPYRTTLRSGQDEQPVGAGVLAYQEFGRRAMAGEMNTEFRIRSSAVQVAFFVTDEPGGPNDIGRFFSARGGGVDWGNDVRTRTTNAAAFFRTRGVVPFGLVPGSASTTCPNETNFAACVILEAGGAFVPISVADSREADRAFTQAMTRIVDVIAGAGSEFVLPTIPISTTLRARVGGTLVPRSRRDGFDYEDRSRALVFRGVRYRPMIGQDVRTAYFVWATP